MVYEGVVFVQSRLIMVQIHKHTFWKWLTFIIQPALVMAPYYNLLCRSPRSNSKQLPKSEDIHVQNEKFVLGNGQISHLNLN